MVKCRTHSKQASIADNLFSECEDGTPLACAASQGHVKVVNFLLAQDAEVNGGYVKVQACNLLVCNGMSLISTYFRLHH